MHCFCSLNFALLNSQCDQISGVLGHEVTHASTALAMATARVAKLYRNASDYSRVRSSYIYQSQTRNDPNNGGTAKLGMQ
jgi:hypothetical protein